MFPQCSNLTNLDELSNLASVGGDFSFRESSNLTNADGLSSLVSVGGDLGALPVTNLDGLSSLVSVGGSLGMGYYITDLDGLSNLVSVGGLLGVGSAYITNLDGLSSLVSVGGALFIRNSSQLTNLGGLSNLASVGGILFIENCPNLTSLDGLSSLISVAAIYLWDCYTLSDITGIRTDILISSGVNMSSIDLTTLSGIGYFPEISSSIQENTGRDDLEEAGYQFLLSLYDAMYPDGRTLPGETDNRPDAFTLNSSTNVATGSSQDSNIITISGLGVGVSVLVAVSSNQSVMIKKNTEAFVAYNSGSISVSNTDTIQLRMTAPASLDKSYTATVFIGGVSSEVGGIYSSK